MRSESKTADNDFVSLPSLANEHLSRLEKTGFPLTLLLVAYNHPWGIGDFVHIRDFFIFCKKYFKENYPNRLIRIHSILFLSHARQKLAELLLDGLISKDEVYIFDDDKNNIFSPQENNAFIIYVTSKYGNDLCPGPFSRKDLNNGTSLENYVRLHNNVINISRPVHVLHRGEIPSLICSALLKNSYSQSIQEYGSPPVIYEGNSVLYDSISMGLGLTEVGIKLFPDLITQKNLAGDKKAIIESSICLKTLLHLTSPEEIENYAQRHIIGFGHLQDSIHLKYFVLTVLALSESRGLSIDIITNCQYVSDFINEMDISSNSPLRKILITHHISSIQYGNNSIKLSDSESKQELRFLNTSGITEQDKLPLMLIADVHAGSGDSSYSEVISSNGFPFFQSRVWKEYFFVGMLGSIDELEKNKTEDLSLFKEYIKILIGFSSKTIRGTQNDITLLNVEDYYFQFLKANYQKIKKQYEFYQSYVYENKNVCDAQVKMINRTLIASILINGTPEEIKKLLQLYTDWKMGDNNFVLFAASTRNEGLLNLLYENNQKKISALLFEPHGFHKNSKTAFAHIVENNLLSICDRTNGFTSPSNQNISQTFFTPSTVSAPTPPAELDCEFAGQSPDDGSHWATFN